MVYAFVSQCHSAPHSPMPLTGPVHRFQRPNLGRSVLGEPVRRPFRTSDCHSNIGAVASFCAKSAGRIQTANAFRRLTWGTLCLRSWSRMSLKVGGRSTVGGDRVAEAMHASEPWPIASRRRCLQVETSPLSQAAKFNSCRYGRAADASCRETSVLQRFAAMSEAESDISRDSSSSCGLAGKESSVASLT